jgi:hypothetical protein
MDQRELQDTNATVTRSEIANFKKSGAGKWK